jgi:hypothetical protein
MRSLILSLQKLLASFSSAVVPFGGGDTWCDLELQKIYAEVGTYGQAGDFQTDRKNLMADNFNLACDMRTSINMLNMEVRHGK